MSSITYNNQRLGLNKSEWLTIREWDCPNCQAHLDRNTNAARNILASRLATL
ncbi:hypothetical protein LTWDN19_20650 (plasmid) [Latilactobacillus curvatus]|uniref:Cas12f1-like TNB domain-containing protein n=1 Tax=Latilactobacillus curvatus TaxID=28038 RepID=A0ABN6GL22_LATCU|nr:hypothetical protein LTWDN19_20650 [Latilactobacillus curvatus]